MKAIIVCLFLFIMLYGCEYIDNKLLVNNKSNIQIKALLNRFYPDTTIENAGVSNTIDSNNVGSIAMVNDRWEDFMQREKKITIFFVDKKEVQYYQGYNKEKYHILKKMIYSKADLDSLKWMIEYP